jgi:hypothetical protein
MTLHKPPQTTLLKMIHQWEREGMKAVGPKLVVDPKIIKRARQARKAFEEDLSEFQSSKDVDKFVDSFMPKFADHLKEMENIAILVHGPWVMESPFGKLYSFSEKVSPLYWENLVEPYYKQGKSVMLNQIIHPLVMALVPRSWKHNDSILKELERVVYGNRIARWDDYGFDELFNDLCLRVVCDLAHFRLLLEGVDSPHFEDNKALADYVVYPDQRNAELENEVVTTLQRQARIKKRFGDKTHKFVYRAYERLATMKHIDIFRKLSDGSLKNYIAKWAKYPTYTEKREKEDKEFSTPISHVPQFREEIDDESMALHVTLDGEAIDRFLKADIHEFTLDSREQGISRAKIQELYDLVDDDALIVQILNNAITRTHTVTEFCKTWKISRSKYYRLLKEAKHNNPALKEYLKPDSSPDPS